MHTNMNDKNIDELINKALQEEQALPEGLSRRLEEQIDAWVFPLVSPFIQIRFFVRLKNVTLPVVFVSS